MDIIGQSSQAMDMIGGYDWWLFLVQSSQVMDIMAYDWWV